MACEGSAELMTELDFVRASAARRPGECLGPGLALWVDWAGLGSLANACVSTKAYDRLRDGFEESIDDQGVMFSRFRQCAGHWMDLAMTVGVAGRLNERWDWTSDAGALVRQVCTMAGWDVKEISNLLHWQRAQVDPD